MIDPNSQNSSEHGGRKRRRRRSSAKSKFQDDTGLVAAIRSRRFGQVVFGAMCIVAIGAVWTSWREVSEAGRQYGPAAIGMDGERLRYALGQPVRIAGHEWDFSESGRTLLVSLNPGSNQVERISCREQDVTALACPALLGVRIGDEEAEVTRLLGRGEASYAGGRAALAYPGLGAALQLDQGKVASITITGGNGDAGRWPIVLLRLLP